MSPALRIVKRLSVIAFSGKLLQFLDKNLSKKIRNLKLIAFNTFHGNSCQKSPTTTLLLYYEWLIAFSNSILPGLKTIGYIYVVIRILYVINTF